MSAVASYLRVNAKNVRLRAWMLHIASFHAPFVLLADVALPFEKILSCRESWTVAGLCDLKGFYKNQPKMDAQEIYREERGYSPAQDCVSSKSGILRKGALRQFPSHFCRKAQDRSKHYNYHFQARRHPRKAVLQSCLAVYAVVLSGF